jgi:integrase
MVQYPEPMPRKPRRRQYGLGSVDRLGPENFRVRWYDEATGKRQSKSGFATAEEAEAGAQAILEESRRRAMSQGPNPANVAPLSVWVDEWLADRSGVLRSSKDDGYRWERHLKPVFGTMRPAEVEPEHVEAFIRAKRSEPDQDKQLKPETIGHCVRLLSRIYSSLIAKHKRTGVRANPVHGLTRDVRRLYKSDHDPRNTPFIERVEDISRIIQALPAPLDVMFAVGAYAGPRPGEVRALAWADVSFERRSIKVWQAVNEDGNLGPLKDDETRFLPILDPLLPILQEWSRLTGGKGFLFPSPRQRRGKKKTQATSFVQPHTYLDALAAVLGDLGLPDLTWYQSTRHTFASHWVMNDGSVAKLADILGHSTTEVTKRYAHLLPGRFSAADLDRLGSENGAIRSELGQEAPVSRPLESPQMTVIT